MAMKVADRIVAPSRDVAYAFDGFCPETEEAWATNLRRFFGYRYRWVSRRMGPAGHWWWVGILRRPSRPRLHRNQRFPVGGALVCVGWELSFGWIEAWGYDLDHDATRGGDAKEMGR